VSNSSQSCPDNRFILGSFLSDKLRPQPQMGKFKRRHIAKFSVWLEFEFQESVIITLNDRYDENSLIYHFVCLHCHAKDRRNFKRSGICIQRPRLTIPILGKAENENYQSRRYDCEIQSYVFSLFYLQPLRIDSKIKNIYKLFDISSFCCLSSQAELIVWNFYGNFLIGKFWNRWGKWQINW
jgi:hypothetical protein